MFDDLFGPEGAKRDGAEIMKALREAANERILILDGAMGTQIQGLGFDEDHFRGDRFIGCACHQKGNNDLLIPSANRMPSKKFTIVTPWRAPIFWKPTRFPRPA